MRLYRITVPAPGHYDATFGVVVAAPSRARALALASVTVTRSDDAWSLWHPTLRGPDKRVVTMLGKAGPDCPKGLILVDFRGG